MQPALCVSHSHDYFTIPSSCLLKQFHLKERLITVINPAKQLCGLDNNAVFGRSQFNLTQYPILVL